MAASSVVRPGALGYARLARHRCAAQDLRPVNSRLLAFGPAWPTWGSRHAPEPTGVFIWVKLWGLTSVRRTQQSQSSAPAANPRYSSIAMGSGSRHPWSSSTMAQRSSARWPSAPPRPRQLDVVQFVKRQMGDKDWRFEPSSGSWYHPEEVSAVILKRLKEDAELFL